MLTVVCLCIFSIGTCTRALEISFHLMILSSFFLNMRIMSPNVLALLFSGPFSPLLGVFGKTMCLVLHERMLVMH